MSDKRASALPFGVPVHEAVIATALAVGAAFLVERVPETTRFSISVGFLVLVAIYLLVALRRIYRIVNETNRATRVLDYRSDDETGILTKGRVRNVALRVETICLLLDDIVSGYPKAERVDRLEAAGYRVGRTWGKEYVRLCRTDLNIDNKPLKDKCEQWAIYDATAGMGRFEFSLTSRGSGSITLRNSFLSDIETESELDHFFCGYLAGCLEELLGYAVTVELTNPSTEANQESEFDVDVPKTRAAKRAIDEAT
jgi:hypothetical protein